MTSKELGNVFRNAREEQGISLKEANWRSRIHPNVIDDIENGVFDRLGKVYVKSFMKKYADFLGIDADDVIRKYEELTVSGEVAPRQEELEQPILEKAVIDTSSHDEVIPEQKNVEDLVVREEKMIMARNAAIALAGILLLFFVIGRVRSCSRARSARQARKKEAVVFAISKKDEVKEVVPQPAPEKVIIVEKPAVQEKPEKVIEEVKEKPAEKEEAVSPQPVASEEDASPLDVTLKARGDVWIQVFENGKTIYVGTLHNGDSKTLTVEEALTVWTGKGEYLDFVVDGQDLGKAADGVIRNINVSKKGIRIGEEWIKRIS